MIAGVSVGIAQRFYEQRYVGHRPDFAQATGGIAPRLRIGVGQRLHGLFPTERLRLRGRAGKQKNRHQSRYQGVHLQPSFAGSTALLRVIV